MIDKFFNIADPSQSTVRVSSYNIGHKGRPTGRDEQKKLTHTFFWICFHFGIYGHSTNRTDYREKGAVRGDQLMTSLNFH